MKALVVSLVCIAAFLLPADLIHAEEIHPQIKHQAEQFDRAMATYDSNISAMMQVDRDGYLAFLKSAREREVSGKRLPAVAAIDAEIAAVEAGERPKDPPANFPKNNVLLTRYREKYITSEERAEKAVASSRRFARENYLNYLTGTAAAIKGKGAPDLEAAIAKEIERVNTSFPEPEKPEEK